LAGEVEWLSGDDSTSPSVDLPTPNDDHARKSSNDPAEFGQVERVVRETIPWPEVQTAIVSAARAALASGLSCEEVLDIIAQTYEAEFQWDSSNMIAFALRDRAHFRSAA
jgi:hypothetical protein